MNTNNFRVDPHSFTKERPLGVSGFMRVKNDAEFLHVCVESCLSALDELVIVLNGGLEEHPRITVTGCIFTALVVFIL